MSTRALLYAAKEVLLANMPCQPTQCDVMFDGKPPYASPDRHIAIWCGQWDPGPHIQMEQGLDELAGATFTVTQACGVAPYDRMTDELVYKLCDGVEWWARRIMETMTKYRWEWICKANELAYEELCHCVPDPPTQVFVSPPVWAGNDPTPRLVGADWLSAEPEDEGDFAIIMDVRFRDAERIQDINSIMVAT